ncbi:hypothetical protein CW713_03245 [Methanophagales archaeon]|nr:MAG: hypothetical protein CW713_03245 [Methanophagales archaeon]
MKKKYNYNEKQNSISIFLTIIMLITLFTSFVGIVDIGIVSAEVEADNETAMISVSPKADWNTWDDDGVITDEEISLAEWYWATSTPKNGHVITNSEISLLEYQWATGEVYGYSGTQKTIAPDTAAITPTPIAPVFEAVFAIAGLLAVAYLVLRKKRRTKT